jgi:SAM-dependent methyltransferase
VKRFAPAASRNRDPILSELRELLSEGARVLEIASGTGQHVVHFAANLPEASWQPSDVDPAALASIRAHVSDSGLDNVREPIELDVRNEDWGVDEVDCVLCCNMVHISPWECSVALFAGAARVTGAAGQLITYGPYRFDGTFTAPSNEQFDRSLKSRDPSWGVRDVEDLKDLAREHDLGLVRSIAMPANNHILVWRR